MRQQKRNKEKTLKLFGFLSLGIGVFINIFLASILRLSGVCERPPIILYAFGFSFLILAMGILNVWLPKVYRKSKSVTSSSFCEAEDWLDLKIAMERDLLPARRTYSELVYKLEENTRIDEQFPITLDTFGRWYSNSSIYSNMHLLITKDAPPNSIQILSNFLNFKNIRPFKNERIDYLVIVGGEVLDDNVDDLVRTLGGIRKCVRRLYPTKILICTSTTNLEALKTISLLRNFIDGFIYVPYNESSLRTLIEFTKFLNKHKIELPKNRLFLLPEIEDLITSIKGLDLKINWAFSPLKDRQELEYWKGFNLRILNN